MRDFSGVAFRGTFRSYQSRILKDADLYKKDGHIHIVAAPGSGKTILGLELIRQLGQPALILAPTVTIRQQWGERLEESFLPAGADVEDYFSVRPDRPRLMTCLTYQALFSAMRGTVEESDAKVDLPSVLRRAGVTTLCLDEAHHLRNEWYQSIVELKERSGISFRTIALTATPPYDSTPAEWKKYIGLCGEIDAEISTPELVAQKTLCPHQDLVYFSRPTDSEAQLVRDYRARASRVVEGLRQGRLLERALRAAEEAPDTDDVFYGEPSGARGFLLAAMREGCDIPRRLRSFLFERGGELGRKGGVAHRELAPKETAYQFVLDHPGCFTEEIAGELRSALKESGLLERNRVCLVSNAELKKTLASSMGKLEGIKAVVRSEKSAMGTRLRMVILTDYIRREYMPKIGGAEALTTMGAVPIFEALRRSLGQDRTLGVLSGSAVILPDAARGEAQRLAEVEGCGVSFRALSDTGYSSASFSGGNKEKVRIVTALFRAGLVQVLIGTTALLGEGWDSPCVNSLVIASFVGSFMLSNQMRGRAIRIDPADPRKVSTIWHLITPDPSSPGLGDDFASVSRRFDSFLAPDFREDKIRSGIDRLGISPYMKMEDLDECDRAMLRVAGDRDGIRDAWERCLACCKGGHPDICQRNEVGADFVPRSFCYVNAIAVWLVALLAQLLNIELYIRLSDLLTTGATADKVLLDCLFLACSCLVVFLGCRTAVRLLSPKGLFRALAESVLLAMRDVGLVESEDVRVTLTADRDGAFISCALRGGTLREKEVYAQAVREMLSPMSSPRYVILRHTPLGLRGRVSFACPSILGKSGERAGCLEKRLNQRLGRCRVFYARNEVGHLLYKKCVKRSFINYRLDPHTLGLRRQEVY